MDSRPPQRCRECGALVPFAERQRHWAEKHGVRIYGVDVDAQFAPAISKGRA